MSNLDLIACKARAYAKKENSKEAAKERRLFPQEIIENDPVWERRINRFFILISVGGIATVYLMVKLGWIF